MIKYEWWSWKLFKVGALEIFRDKRVYYKVRSDITIVCKAMEFALYPLDNHKCYLILTSCKWPLHKHNCSFYVFGFALLTDEWSEKVLLLSCWPGWSKWNLTAILLRASSCLKNSGFSEVPKRKLLAGLPPLLPKKQECESISRWFLKTFACSTRRGCF